MSSLSDFPWFQKVDKSNKDVILQDRSIFNCPIIIPSVNIEEEKQKLKAHVEEYNVIILSQSCDLENDKLETVIACPISTFEELSEANPATKSSKWRERAVWGCQQLSIDRYQHIT